MGRADIFVPPAVGIRKYACEFLDWTPWYRRLLLLNMSWISSRKQKYLFSSLPGWYFDCQLPKDGIWFPLKRKTASPKEPERILNQTQICIWSGPELIRSNKHTYTYYVYVCLFDRINSGPLQKPFSLRMFGTPKRGVWGGVQNVLTEKGVWRRVPNDLRTLRVKKVSNAGSRTTS